MKLPFTVHLPSNAYKPSAPLFCTEEVIILFINNETTWNLRQGQEWTSMATARALALITMAVGDLAAMEGLVAV